MNNVIYLRRRGKVFIEKGNSELPINYVSAMLKNIESLGYAFSAELIERLQTLSLEDVTVFYNELVDGLKQLVGAHRIFNPFYPNFPKQVMEMAESRLYINALIHYLTNRLPNYVKEPRLILQDKIELKIIELGTKEEFEQIFTQIVASNTSISEQDKNDISWYINNYKENIFDLIPSEIPQKENLAYLGAEMFFVEGATEFLRKHLKTATDILRLACAMCGGDVSLAKATRFVKISRRERKFLLELLESCGNLTEDMLRWKKRWIRLGERLHVGEFKTRFPRSFEAFDILRNNKPFQTFNGKIEGALLSKNSAQVVELLKPRAGDFARRLDQLLRLSETDAPFVLESFAELAPQVSTPVLLQVMTHFEYRNSPKSLRVFFPKGEVAKVQGIENKLPPFSFAIPKAVTAICEETLTARFAELPPLGKCFLDEKLKDYLVPFSQRSAAKALKTIVRGSKMMLPKTKVLRFFIWWKNGKYRTDIDLSAAMFDTNYNYVDVLSYYNLKGFGGCHSGDIVDAPEGAAEFIDVELEKLIEKNVRFVVMAINSFTNQPFCDLPECFAGWMARTHADSGEIFEPRTVQNKIDVASDTKICLPLIIDLAEKQVIWTDIALKKYPSWNNVANNLSGISLMLRAMTNLTKTTLYDLFSLHIKARGELVLGKKQANKIFSVDDGITPFQLDIIASEFMK
ncbi:MAG TPA: TerD family protein [Pyrinomonadaceae bacterium]|nr:TerD family protein [Pyrinomonadaceae bacterium]